MALALDGSVHKNVVGPASTTVTLSTSNAGDVIVAFITINLANVASISSANTTGWTARKVQGTGTGSFIEEWRGVAASALSSEVITLSFGVGVGFTTIDVFGISGADTTTIYDSNAALPDGGTTGNRSITTTNANDILIAGYRFGSTANPTQGTGWTKISGADFQLTEYLIVSATQSGTAAAIGTGSGDQNAGIADAIIQASAGDAGALIGGRLINGGKLMGGRLVR